MYNKKRLMPYNDGGDMSYDKRTSILETKVFHIDRNVEDLKENVKDLREDVKNFKIETKNEFRDVRSEISKLSEKIDSHFKWLVGLLFTSWFTLFGAIITILLRT